MLPDDRRELWLLGLGLGLCADAALLLAAVNQRWPLTAETLPAWLAVAWAVTVLGLFGLPLAVGTVRAIAAIVVGLDMWRHRNDAPPIIEAAPLEFPPVDDAEARAWVTALSRFFRGGDAAGGFSVRKLAGVISEPAWARLTEFYSSDAGNRVLRVGPGDQGTVWNWGWELDYVLQRINAHGLPHPDGPVPEVEIYVLDTTRQGAKRRSTAAKTVVEGVARSAE